MPAEPSVDLVDLGHGSNEDSIALVLKFDFGRVGRLRLPEIDLRFPPAGHRDTHGSMFHLTELAGLFLDSLEAATGDSRDESKGEQCDTR